LKCILGLALVVQDALADVPNHRPVPANDRAEGSIVSLNSETPQQIPIGQASETVHRHQVLDVVQQGSGRGRFHEWILAWIWCYLYLVMRSEPEMARYSSDCAPFCLPERRKLAAPSGRDGTLASSRWVGRGSKKTTPDRVVSQFELTWGF
jgi:hypothetical protein